VVFGTHAFDLLLNTFSAIQPIYTGSLEWSLISYVYSFDKDVLSSWMCAKIFYFPSSFLSNSMKLLQNFWHIVFCHYVWPHCIHMYVCYTELLSLPFQWVGESELLIRKLPCLILESI